MTWQKPDAKERTKARREYAKNRFAQQRAALSPDELEALRASNRAAQARRRERLTEEERQAHREYQNAYNANLRRTVLTYYGGDPAECACCGEQQIEFLAIDHINGGGGQHRREIGGPSGNAGGATLARWLKRNGYPDGFRVLCHNCNFSRGHYGACPHEKERVVSIMRGKAQ